MIISVKGEHDPSDQTMLKCSVVYCGTYWLMMWYVLEQDLELAKEMAEEEDDGY
jgi:hypothetical protein